MRFVELKSAEQLDLQSLHRVRDRLVGERTALMNQLRAVLMERGITVPQGRRKLEQHLSVILDGEELRLTLIARPGPMTLLAAWQASLGSACEHHSRLPSPPRKAPGRRRT
jgi:transposase